MSSVSVIIEKFDRNREHGHIEYHIKVFYNGREWRVRKRYSEFAQLHEYLLCVGHNIQCKFPKKTYNIWSQNEKKLSAKRQKELQLYLDYLLKNFPLTTTSVIKEFLEVDQQWLQKMRKQSTQEIIKHEVILKSIPQEFNSAVIPLKVKSNATQTSSRTTSFRYVQEYISRSFSTRAPSRKGSFQTTTAVNTTNTNTNTNLNMNTANFENSNNLLTHTNSNLSPRISHTNSLTGYNGNTTMTKDRKGSIDYLVTSLMSNNNNNNNNNAAYSEKKQAYLNATNKLWVHYKKEIQDIQSKDDVKFENEKHQIQQFIIKNTFDSDRNTVDHSLEELYEQIHRVHRTTVEDQYPVEKVLYHSLADEIPSHSNRYDRNTRSRTSPYQYQMSGSYSSSNKQSPTNGLSIRV